jgi:hypothetical protein
MTDILDLKGWKALSKTQSNGEEVIEAEYTIQPKACQKCGVIDRLYRHGSINEPDAWVSFDANGDRYLRLTKPDET